MKKICRNQGGYTIIEMLSVLALLALMAAVVFPQVRQLSRCELDSTARLMAADLRMIRQEAITTGRFCSILFLIYEDCYLIRMPGEDRVVDLPGGVRYEGGTTFSGTPPTVRFNRMGRPTGGGTVTLRSSDGEQLYVILAPVTGRVRISSEPPAHW